MFYITLLVGMSMLMNSSVFHESIYQELQTFCPKCFFVVHEHAHEISLLFMSLLDNISVPTSKCHNFLILSPIFVIHILLESPLSLISNGTGFMSKSQVNLKLCMKTKQT